MIGVIYMITILIDTAIIVALITFLGVIVSSLLAPIFLYWLKADDETES